MRYIVRSLFILGLIIPTVASAQLEITEIMYDPEGSDSGREWIEIFNSSNEPVTIIGGTVNGSWRLFEESAKGVLSKRTFSFNGGPSITIPPLRYAIIANEVDKFVDDFPEFFGILMTSKMSLTNSEGRRLVIVNGTESNMSNVVTYAPVPEASGTGASLQRQLDGTWIPALPTPGEENSDNRYELSDGGDGEEVGSTSGKDEFLELESKWPFTDEIVYVNAGQNIRAFVGQEIEFSGEARLRGGDVPRRANFNWAFGDGKGDRGRDTTHSYRRQGEYNVVLTVEYSGRSFRDRIRVQVVDQDIISMGEVGDDFVEVVNSTDHNIDISGWGLESGEEKMTFALGTYLLPKNTVAIPFRTDPSKGLYLLDTNNKTIVSVAPTASMHRDDYAEILQRLADILANLRTQIT